MMNVARIFVLSILVHSLQAQPLPVCTTPANGSAWTYLGPVSPPTPGPGAGMGSTGTGAQVRVKFFDPKATNPTELYAATPTGGLFRTRNVLDSVPVWENLTDSTRLPVLGVRDFEFEPGNPDVMYLGTGIRYPLDLRRAYGIGLLKTTDDGRSWQPTGLTFEPPGSMAEVVHDILVHPQNPDTLHVLSGKNYYRSDDGGASFTLKNTNPHPCPAGWESAWRAILTKPGSPQVLYLTADAGYFFISKNSGETWAEIAVDSSLGITEPVMRMDVAVSEHNPELIYLGCSAQKNEFILRSLDGGASWQLVLKKNLGSSYEKHVFAISPNGDNVLYAGGLYVHQVTISQDGKATSKQIAGSEIHMDHRELCVVSDGNGGDILYSANDGGLYRGVVDGKKWRWRDVSGLGFNNMQFYGIAVAEDFSVVPGGTQDLGTMLIYRDEKAVKPNLGGDGTDCAVDPFNPANIFSISWALGPPVIFRSTDGGVRWSRWNKGTVANGDSYYHPMIFHENGYLYTGTTKVQRLPYGSDTWQQIGDIHLPTDNPWRVTAMSVAMPGGEVIYAYGDQLYRTDDANADSAVWQPLGEKMGDAAKFRRGSGVMLAVETDPANPRKVWVSFKTFDSPFKVWFSGDGGETWGSTGPGLPPFPVSALAFQAGTADVLYAGTDVGVFVNFNASDPNSEWQCFNSGLPVCLVSDLEMNYCQGKIVAGTFGRGIWESPLALPSDFKTIEVDRDAVWDFMLLRSDVVVKKGTTLTLRGEIRIASGKKIVVEKDAVLVLDGAHLADLCGEPWAGIVTEQGNSGFLGLFFGTDPGKVELKNRATVD
ncbi:MAG: hypothetical protein HY842_04885 [Bacteroidetes bacterium]|nr:hypothetical protein [Bacteroidota bacterium]